MKGLNFLLKLLAVAILFHSVAETRGKKHAKKSTKQPKQHSKKAYAKVVTKVATKVLEEKTKYEREIQVLNEKLNNINQTITNEKELLSYHQQNIYQQLKIYETEKKANQVKVKELSKELENVYQLHNLAREFTHIITSRSHQIIQKKDWLKLEKFAQKLGIIVNDTTQGKGSHSTSKFVDLETNTQICHETISSKKRYYHLKHILELLTKKLPNESKTQRIENESKVVLQNYEEIVETLNRLMNNITVETQEIQRQLELKKKKMKQIDALISKADKTLQSNLRRLESIVDVENTHTKQKEAGMKRYLVALEQSSKFYQICLENGFANKINVITDAEEDLLKKNVEFRRLFTKFYDSLRFSFGYKEIISEVGMEFVLSGGFYLDSRQISSLYAGNLMECGVFFEYDNVIKLNYFHKIFRKYLLNSTKINISDSKFDQLLIKGILLDIEFIFYNLLVHNLEININNILCYFLMLWNMDKATYETFKLKHQNLQVSLDEKSVKDICTNSHVMSLLQQIMQSPHYKYINNDTMTILRSIILYLDSKANFTKLLSQEITVDNLHSYQVLPENNNVYNKAFLERLFVSKLFAYKRHRSQYNFSSLWIDAAKQPKYQFIWSIARIPPLPFFRSRFDNESYAFQLIANWSRSLK